MEARRGSGRSPGRSSRRKFPGDGLGRFWPGAGTPKCQPDGPRWGPHEAKMEPRWPKNEPRWPSGEPRWPKRGPRWPSGGPLGSYLGDFSRSWERSLPRSPKYKIEQPYNVFLRILGSMGVPLEALGGHLGRSWLQGRLCWPVLASSWA